MKFLINNSYFLNILIRYVLYGLSAIEVLLLPKFLDESTYSEIEYIKNLMFLSPFLLFGVPSGYLYFKYSELVDVFDYIYSVGILFSSICGVIIAISFNNSILGFLCSLMIIATLLEQRLVVKRYFILASAFKPIISIFIIVFSTFTIRQSINLSASLLLLYSVLSAFMIWFFLQKNNIKCNFDFSRTSFNFFKKTLYKGFPITFSTILLSILFFADRFFIKTYYTSTLATYSFAFNLSQIVVLALTTIGYISTAEIGEQKKNIDKLYLIERYKIGILIFLILFILLVFILLYIIPYFYKFNDLFLITCILTFTKGLFFSTSIIMPVVMYYDYHTLLAKILFILVVLFLGIDYLLCLNGIDFYFVLVANACCLIIYTFICLFFIFIKIDYVQNQ